MTNAGALKAKKVIHAVGPVYTGGGHGEPQLLASAYTHSLRLAREAGLRSISFPSLSTGAYGYPIEAAARIALASVRVFLLSQPGIEMVRFVLFGQAAYDVYARALERIVSDPES